MMMVYVILKLNIIFHIKNKIKDLIFFKDLKR